MSRVNAARPIGPVEDDATHELERLEGSRHIERMRRIEELLPGLSNVARSRQSRAFRALAAEFSNAALKCDRYAPEQHTPDYLRRGSSLPLTRKDDR